MTTTDPRRARRVEHPPLTPGDRRAFALIGLLSLAVNMAIYPAYIPWIWTDMQRPLLEALHLPVGVGLAIYVLMVALIVAVEAVAVVIMVVIAFRPTLTVKQAWRTLRRQPITDPSPRED